MKIKVDNKEYSIKFGLKPTLKTHLVSKVVKVEDSADENIEGVEKLIELIPEMLLVGLQVHHKDEFGFDYDNNEEYNAKLDLAYDILEKYLESEGADLIELYHAMENELLENSFLSSLFQREKAEQTQKTEKKGSTSKNGN